MRYAVVLLVFLAVLTVGGTYLSQNPGEVAITVKQIGTAEMSLWYFLVALAVLVLALMGLFKVLWTLIRIPTIAKRFGKNRRTVVTNNLLQKGMLAMGKGQWKKAENLLVKGSRLAHQSNIDPGLFLSSAAQAAHQQGANARRDQYLLEARQLSAEGRDILTSSLSEARLYLENNEPQKALATIKPHRAQHSQNPQLLVIESEAYEQMGDYHQVWHLLSSLKRQFTDKEEYKQRQKSVAKSLFVHEKSGLEDIEKVWSELPSAAKREESVFLNYISGLINHDQEEKAEQLLAKAIRKDFADPIIHAYTQLEIGSSTSRLAHIRQWLKYRPENAYLNYGAAKLAYQSEQFEAAKDYAETSLKSQPLPETFALLGKIYEALGEGQQALQAYKGSVGLLYAEQPAAIAGEVLPADTTVALPSSAPEPDTDNITDKTANA